MICGGRSGTLIAALAAAIAMPACAEPQWREYVYADQQFAAAFPAEPSVVTVEAGDPGGVTEKIYSVDEAATHFQVAVFDLIRTHIEEPAAIARAAGHSWASLRSTPATTQDANIAESSYRITRRAKAGRGGACHGKMPRMPIACSLPI